MGLVTTQIEAAAVDVRRSVHTQAELIESVRLLRETAGLEKGPLWTLAAELQQGASVPLGDSGFRSCEFDRTIMDSTRALRAAVLDQRPVVKALHAESTRAYSATLDRINSVNSLTTRIEEASDQEVFLSSRDIRLDEVLNRAMQRIGQRLVERYWWQPPTRQYRYPTITEARYELDRVGIDIERTIIQTSSEFQEQLFGQVRAEIAEVGEVLRAFEVECQALATLGYATSNNFPFEHAGRTIQQVAARLSAASLAGAPVDRNVWDEICGGNPYEATGTPSLLRWVGRLRVSTGAAARAISNLVEDEVRYRCWQVSSCSEELLQELADWRARIAVLAAGLADDLARIRQAVASRLNAQSTITAALAQVDSQLWSSLDAWDGRLRSNDHDFSEATKSALVRIAEDSALDFAIGGFASEWQSSLDEAEFRVVIAGTMKSGKSTILSLLTGVDVGPSRSHPATAIATRVVIRSAESSSPFSYAASETERRIIDCVRKIGLDNVRQLTEGTPHLLAAAEEALSAKPDISMGASNPQVASRRLAMVSDLIRVIARSDTAKATRLARQCVPEVTISGGPLGAAGGRLKLVLIDTPGPNESGLREVAQPVLDDQLWSAHACILVTDYRYLGSQAEVNLGAFVADWAKERGPQALSVIVNHIDQRTGVDDPDLTHVRAMLSARLRIADRDLQLSESSARLAAVVEQLERSDDRDDRPARLWAEVVATLDPHGSAAMGRLPEKEVLRRASTRSGLDVLRERQIRQFGVDRRSTFVDILAARLSCLKEDARADIQMIKRAELLSEELNWCIEKEHTHV